MRLFRMTAIFFSLLKFIFILYALVFCLHVCLCVGIRSLGTEVTDRCCESNPGPLEKQLVFLSAESSFLACSFPLSLFENWFHYMTLAS